MTTKKTIRSGCEKTRKRRDIRQVPKIQTAEGWRRERLPPQEKAKLKEKK